MALVITDMWTALMSTSATITAERNDTRESGLGSEVIVTGMHRSGTSLLSSLLHASGVDMGDDLVGPGVGNEFGHCEDLTFVRFHQKVLNRSRKPGALVDTVPAITENDRVRARRILAERCHKPLRGWKCPRTSLFIDLWHSLSPNAKWIFMVRHPCLVVDSLRRRDDQGPWWWKSDTIKVRTWCEYTRECIEFASVNPEKAIVIELDRALARPARLTAALSEFLEHPIGNDLFRSLYQESAIRRRLPLFSTFILPLDYLRAMRLYSRALSMSAI